MYANRQIEEIMKKLVIILCFSLFLWSSKYVDSQVRAYDPFRLSSQRIQEAIVYGTTSSYEIDEFGSYDIGLNKFHLGDGIGYVEIATPFVAIATMARKLRNLREDFHYADAKKLAYYPPQIRAVLYTNEKYANTRVDCVLIAKEEIFVLSNDVLESTICGDGTNSCVRLLVYFMPVDKMRNATHFTLVLKNPAFGQKKIDVNVAQLK